MARTMMMNRPGLPVAQEKPKPPVEPLRQFGVGPALLAAYVLVLAALHFTLVTTWSKPFMGSC
jgi:hypothetical protein